jgi:RimJ/RimL family protein N-acetyltransferase
MEGSHAVQLREVCDDDLPIFFEHQLHPAANHMAAFTPRDPSDRAAFSERWLRLRADDTVLIRTVLYEGRVAGSILKYEEDGRPEVSYWLGREFWGRGVATRALTALLDLLTTRPLFARVAKDNIASLRVLEKCGFRIAGEDRGFAHARGEEVEEYVLKLDARLSAGGGPA